MFIWEYPYLDWEYLYWVSGSGNGYSKRKKMIDKIFCKNCDFGDKKNEGICISKMMGGKCKFDKGV